jgi:hypothetical protein
MREVYCSREWIAGQQIGSCMALEVLQTGSIDGWFKKYINYKSITEQNEIIL